MNSFYVTAELPLSLTGHDKTTMPNVHRESRSSATRTDCVEIELQVSWVSAGRCASSIAACLLMVIAVLACKSLRTWRM